MPEGGRLLVQSEICRLTFRFCFRDLDDPQRFKNICQIQNISRPERGGFSAVPNFSICPGAAEENARWHYCRCDELLAVKNLWGSELFTFNKWRDRTLGLEGLLECEKRRMKRLFCC